MWTSPSSESMKIRSSRSRTGSALLRVVSNTASAFSTSPALKVEWGESGVIPPAVQLPVVAFRDTPGAPPPFLSKGAGSSKAAGSSEEAAILEVLAVLDRPARSKEIQAAVEDESRRRSCLAGDTPGTGRGQANASAYNAANFAVDGFTQALAKEMATHNITVNCVCPGLTETSRMDPMGRSDRWDARSSP